MGCIKNQYDTYKEALDAAKGNGNRIKTHFTPYKCPHCDKFHLTSSKPRKMYTPKDKYPINITPIKEIEMPTPEININYKPEKNIIHTGKVFKK